MSRKTPNSMTISSTTARVAVATIVALAGAAHAQCNPTLNAPPGITYPEGVNGNVLCSTVWDPDGTGPQSPVLVVGGQFDSASSGGFNNIAMWDGSGWKPMHVGVNAAVRALTVDTTNNTLIAGGSFSTAGIVSASRVARYSSGSGLWSAIGTGITSAGDVNALAFDPLRGHLYVGGSFTTAGGVSTGVLARYNGSSYSAVSAFFSGTINALYYWEGDGSVYVGGTFVDPTLGNAANILRFYPGNSSWSGLNGGLPGSGVYAITSYSDDGLNHRIVAGGNFGSIGGTTFNSVARFNGSGWFPMASGLAGTVRSLATRGTDLHAVGSFSLSGTGLLVNRTARWNGTSWGGMSSGVDGTAFTVTNYKDAMHVGGAFNLATNADGNTSVSRIAMHDGLKWSALKGAPSGPVRCMLSLGSNLHIGGAFEMHVGGGTFAHNLVTFNGSQFVAGVGIQGFNGTNGPINAISYKSNGVTIGTYTVAGKFTQAGAVNATNIASYQFAGEFSQVGQGVTGEVYGLASFGTTGGPNASIGTVATGNFTASGATPVSFIARWGPGAVSLNLGAGLNGPGRCLLNYQGKLLVGGYFTTAGGALTGHLAQWDGTNWSTFNGAFVNDHVLAMTTFNGNLVIAGNFTGINNSPMHKVAMYDGNTWIDMGAGISTAVGSPSALVVHNGELYAAGYFATSGNQPNTFAKWNGFSWVPAGGEVTGGYEVPSVNALATFGGTLYAGGSFTRAGTAYSPYLAQHSCSCYVNCDNSTGSPLLTGNDFSCFLNNYAVGTSYANCDGVGGLTANDFQCFLTKYAAGCN